MNLNFLITSIRAGPYVPEEHEYNGWHWGVNVGEEYYWEIEMIATNASSGEVLMMFKDIWIYNITSIENVTIDYFGVNDFSQIKATQCYYNDTTGELEPYGSPNEMALFGYNNSDSIKHKYRAGSSLIPLIFPLNGSNNIEVDILDDILNESCFEPLSLYGYNTFDGYSSNTGDNSITFTNSTDNYYMDIKIGSTDGVAESIKGYIEVNMGELMLLISHFREY